MNRTLWSILRPALILILSFATVTTAYAQDSDADGMPDSHELAFGCLMPFVADGDVDYDSDGLTSLAEYTYSPSLNPCAADTDGDLAPDDWEIAHTCVDPLKPSNFSTSFTTAGYPNDVSVSGDYAYIVESGDGLLVVNISDPSNPTLIGESTSYAVRVFVDGNYAYLVSNFFIGGYHLDVVDVSDPANPEWVTYLEGPTYPDSSELTGIYAVGDYVYVVSWQSYWHGYGPSGDFFDVYDFSNHTSLAWVGGYELGGFGDVFVSGIYAFVSEGSRLLSFDISDPSDIALIGSSSYGPGAGPLFVSGNHVYAAGSGLKIIDVTDPANPTLSSELATPGSNYDIHVAGGNAYLAEGSRGVQVVNVTNPASPFLGLTYDTPGDARGVFVSGNYIYVADGASGLRILAIPDQDSDGITDSEEYALGTNPCSNDSDGDGMEDGWESAHPCLNPIAGDSLQDGDTDGLTNLAEKLLGTDPCDEDTDGDGSIDSADCGPRNRNTWDTCATCKDTDGDGRYQLCNDYTGISGPDCNDTNQYHWSDCGVCVDYDGDGYGDNCNMGTDCNDNDPGSWYDCEWCYLSDYDGDHYGEHCQLGPDCNDFNPNTWDTCYTCQDLDNDGWLGKCNRYNGINGPDCNDGDADHWSDCGNCVDTDGDDRGVNCNRGEDCSETLANAWISCATCKDEDGDGWWVGCDRYVNGKGPDCDDGNPNAWNTCAACKDDDADGWYVGCNQYASVNGPDCDDAVDTGAGCTSGCSTFYQDSDGDGHGKASPTTSRCALPSGYALDSADCNDANARAWNTCATCVDPDGDGRLTLCNDYTGIQGPDCDGDNPYTWDSCGTCMDGDGDGWVGVCNRYSVGDGGTITVGSGKYWWGFPFTTYYHDARTEVIYLASEIGSAGLITSVALHVVVVPGQVMENFTIRMKYTDLAAYPYGQYPSWDGPASGWTTVYQADEPPGVTGWHSFTLSTPFAYNGIENLMVDFSFNNSSSAASSGLAYYYNGGDDMRMLVYYTNSAYGDPLSWSGTSNPIPGMSNGLPILRFTLDSNIDGPDCDDADDQVWVDCASDCQDDDGDGYGRGCPHDDCDDSKPSTWNTCATCVDMDGDGWYQACNDYTGINGPDCNDRKARLNLKCPSDGGGGSGGGGGCVLAPEGGGGGWVALPLLAVVALRLAIRRRLRR